MRTYLLSYTNPIQRFGPPSDSVGDATRSTGKAGTGDSIPILPSREPNIDLGSWLARWLSANMSHVTSKFEIDVGDVGTGRAGASSPAKRAPPRRFLQVPSARDVSRIIGSVSLATCRLLVMPTGKLDWSNTAEPLAIALSPLGPLIKFAPSVPFFARLSFLCFLALFHSVSPK